MKLESKGRFETTLTTKSKLLILYLEVQNIYIRVILKLPYISYNLFIVRISLNLPRLRYNCTPKVQNKVNYDIKFSKTDN